MSGAITKLPPQNIEAEQSVLGAMLLDNDAVTKVLEFLQAEAFYRGGHREIFSAMIELYQKNEPADLITVTNVLKSNNTLEDVGGPEYLAGLVAGVPTAANVIYYARIVYEKSVLRHLISSATEIVERGYSEGGEVDVFLDEAERIIFECAQKKIKQSFYSIKDIVKDSFKTIERLYERKELITGVPTGYTELDRLTAGLQPSELIILAGRPSMGKTALALNMMAYAAVQMNIPSAIFSLEMSKESLVQRLLCSEAKVGGSKLRGGFLAESDWPKLTRAAGSLSESPIYIDDTPAITVLEMRAKARRLQKDKGIKLIIVDYLQLMRGVGRLESREREISEISGSLKALAKELKVPVIAVSQLNRAVENRQDKRPQMADLRECVTGDTHVSLANGRRVPIAKLVGTTPHVWAKDKNNRLISAQSDMVWKVGRRPVFKVNFASGRNLRATGQHRLYGADGWLRVENMKKGDRIALARRIPENSATKLWPEKRLMLLAHMIGDGSYLNHQPLRYTTGSEENSFAVKDAAESEFGCKVNRRESKKGWHQLEISGNGNRWHHAGIGAWFRELGIFDQRSHEKHVPEDIFTLNGEQTALFLKHLWATDGTIHVRKNGARGQHTISYSTNSSRLAGDVSAMLLRLGIVARIRKVKQGRYKPAYHVEVSGGNYQKIFLDKVGGFGPKAEAAEKLAQVLSRTGENTNVDTLPKDIFKYIRAKMAEKRISHRAMASRRGTSYGGSAHFNFAPSRAVVAEYAELLNDDHLRSQASSDLFWDTATSIEPDGEDDVYDLTVPGHASWLADGIVSHNSGAIEQDADVIMFIYRDEVYNRETTEKGIAEVIIGKQRNGPIGFAKLAFLNDFTKFENLAKGVDESMQPIDAAGSGDADDSF